MSAHTTIDIDYLASLARLELTASEKALFSSQLATILDYFQRLNRIETSGVEPSAHAFPLENVWADDTVGTTLAPDAAARNAPAWRDQQFVVPKIIDEV